MSYTYSGSDWTCRLRKAALSGGVAYVAGMVFGEDGQTQIFGQNVSMPTALAGSTALGSVAADVAHDYVLPYIPGNDKFNNAESAVLGLGISGGTAAWLLNEGNVINQPAFNTFLLGAGSYAAGEWIDKKFFYGQGGNALGYF